ncbi:MAG TPA: hypothetical protein VGU24_07175 [Microvirga sp.]|jgi:hypothetical protein|nr:hypothetical protein [Microvirga sp.]
MHIIFFLPGILGSKLFLGEEEVWPPTLGEITLGYERIEKLVDPACVPGEVIKRVCICPIYEPILADLARLADGDRARVREFAYDWRLDIRQTADAFARALNDAISDGAERISVVAHSMGGLVARLALEDPRYAAAPWLAKVSDLLLLAVPQLGAPLALARALGLEGTTGLAPEDLKEIAKDGRYPALYQLLPAPGQQAVWNATRNGTTLLDLYDAATAQALGLAAENIEVARATHARLAAGQRPDATRYIHLGATGLSTCLRIELAGPTGNMRPRMIAADDTGDGTVPLWSAVSGSRQHHVTPGDHVKFFTDELFREMLFRLFGQRLPAVPFATADEKPRIAISIDAFTYAAEAHIDVLLVPLNATARIDGALALQGSAGPAGADDLASARPPIAVRYEGPALRTLRVRMTAPAHPGQYRLSFSGTHATGPTDTAAFAVSQAV